MTATSDQLEAVLSAARTLLEARQLGMLTVREWLALARAVAPRAGCQTADLLTPRDLENIAEYGLPWDEGVDGPLPTDDD